MKIVGWARFCAHAVSEGYFRVGTKPCPPYIIYFAMWVTMRIRLQV